MHQTRGHEKRNGGWLYSRDAVCSMPGVSRLLILLLLVLLLAMPCCDRNRAAGETSAARASVATGVTATLLRPLIDQAKLATLGVRGTNPRIQKAVAILYEAKCHGEDPAKVAADAVTLIGWGGTPRGDMTAEALLRNLDILEKLGATTLEDIDRMKHGHAPTVRTGPYTGDIISVDHIVPRAVAPELDNVVANLELLPLRVNIRKNDKVGRRHLDVARNLHAGGLLSVAGLGAVLARGGGADL